MSKTRRQPSEEEIAAFAAGRLQGAERSRMIEQLDRDPESYQLLLETIDLVSSSEGREEDSEDDEIAPWQVDPQQLSVSRWRVAALAASAVLALGLGWLIYRMLPPDGPGQLASELGTRLTSQTPAEELNQSAWRETPSSTFARAQPPLFASFQLGRLMLDLEIARLADDLQRGLSLLTSVESLLAVQQAGPTALEEAAEARRKAEAQQSLQGLDYFPERIGISLPNSWDSLFVEFGQWAEAARLASLHQQEDFFRQPAFQEFSQELGRREDLSPQARRPWEEAQALLDRPRLDPDGWDELAGKWTDLIRLH